MTRQVIEESSLELTDGEGDHQHGSEQGSRRAAGRHGAVAVAESLDLTCEPVAEGPSTPPPHLQQSHIF